MKNEINIEKIKACAQAAYRAGDFYCSEAVVHAVRENIDPDMPEGLVAAASGFPAGVGGAKCVCGAVSGGVICLGYFFGRTRPQDPKGEKAMELAFELQEGFKANHKVLCCHSHTRGMDMEKGEHKEQCAGFTGEMAAKTAEIIARELRKR